MENEFPLVSIITVTHNRVNLIHRAINSVLNQTYPNIEYIIVGSGCADNTKEFVLSYDNPHIKYIAQECNNPNIASNAALAESHGKYIAFLDDDDEYLPDKIEKQVKLFESLSGEYGLVYCWMSYYDSKDKKFLRLHKPMLRGDVGDNVVEKARVSGTPTLMIRRDLLIKYGGTMKNNIGLWASDWEMAARICQHCKVDYVPCSLVNVYINHGEKRLTNINASKEWLNKTVIFHEYFLKEFSHVFDKYPKKRKFHFKNLVIAYCCTGKWRSGISYYLQLLKIDFNLHNLLLLPYCMYRIISKK